MSHLKTSKTTSYKDLLSVFQKSETAHQTPRQKKGATRFFQPKKSSMQQNKQNIAVKNHIRSVYQKSQARSSASGLQQDLLKEYNNKRKNRQLHLSYNKFISYITGVMQKLTGTVPPDSLMLKLTYLQFLAALKEMCMIKETYEPSSNDCVTELWNQISGHGQTVGIFIIFMTGILNMRKNEEIQDQRTSHLWEKYRELRYTRMEQLGKIKTIQREEYSFSPMISQRSRALAVSHSKSKSVLRDKCLVNKSELQYVEESNENTTRNTISKQKGNNTTTGNRRSLILFKLAQEKSQEKRRDKKSSEVEYQKSIKELTFQPQIHYHAKENQKKTATIQGEQDSINRIIRGRIERQVKAIIHEKGLPYNEKMFQKMKREKYEQYLRSRTINIFDKVQVEESNQAKQTRQKNSNSHDKKQKGEDKKKPLVLNIEIEEGRCEKLVIHSGECYKEVAAQFIKQYKLESQMYEKLIEGVQQALKCQLEQIDEDSSEQEFQSSK